MSDVGVPLIYVVDDEQIIASTITLILKQKGYDAEAFFNPVEALQACKKATPSVLLSDVVMPQMTGVELAIAMQEQHPSCRLLLFSGQSATSMYLEDAHRRGYSFQVLAKPIHPSDLLKRIADVIAGR